MCTQCLYWFFFFFISVVYVLFVFLFILAATWPVSWVSLEWTVPRSVHVTTRTATQCQEPATYVRNPSCLSLGKANVISPAFCYVICYGDTEELLKCWDILVGSSISHIFHYVKGRGGSCPVDTKVNLRFNLLILSGFASTSVTKGGTRCKEVILS